MISFEWYKISIYDIQCKIYEIRSYGPTVVMLLQQLKQPRLSFGHLETSYEDLVFILTLDIVDHLLHGLERVIIISWFLNHHAEPLSATQTRTRLAPDHRPDFRRLVTKILQGSLPHLRSQNSCGFQIA